MFLRCSECGEEIDTIEEQIELIVDLNRRHTRDGEQLADDIPQARHAECAPGRDSRELAV